MSAWRICCDVLIMAHAIQLKKKTAKMPLWLGSLVGSPRLMLCQQKPGPKRPQKKREIRVISCRKTTASERRFYEEGSL